MAFGVVESAVRTQTDNARGAIYVDSCKIGCSVPFDSAVPPGSFSFTEINFDSELPWELGPARIG